MSNKKITKKMPKNTRKLQFSKEIFLLLLFANKNKTTTWKK
jgi:hypothetical protein